MISETVYARWSPMWAKGCLPSAPWWTVRACPEFGIKTVARIGSDASLMTHEWVRADGRTLGVEFRFTAWSDEAARKGEAFAGVVADVDREHPLPAPPPMPGQVWVVGDDEVWIPSLLPSVGRPWLRAWPCFADGIEVDPSKGAILVAGPTPRGPNVPWADTREKP